MGRKTMDTNERKKKYMFPFFNNYSNFPTKDIDELFPNNDWPIGILQEYSSK